MAAINEAGVQFAIDELATRLVIPADLMTVHREHSTQSRSGRFQSIRYGAFLLTYGPFERFFNRLIEVHGGQSRGLAATTDKLRASFDKNLGVSNVTRDWAARVRVAPAKESSFKRGRWTCITGSHLRDYLSDARSLRNLLAHGADPCDAENTASSFYIRKDGGRSVTLMWAEGFLQAVQDLASITALHLAGGTVALPQWPMPKRTGLSAKLPDPPYSAARHG